MNELPAPASGAAWFFDFDGTLVPIAPSPDRVASPDGLASLLSRLQSLDVALAVVTGRPLAEIDAHLAPLRLPCAGVHGVERRDSNGRLHRVEQPDLTNAVSAIQALCRREPSLRCEVKPGAVALHFRQAPQLQPLCEQTMADVAAVSPGMVVLRGKMVLELKPAIADKGRAVRAFLEEPPFRQRRPWYFGDDVTDEAAFQAVQDLGGVGVKIGDGETAAMHRLSGPGAMQAWLGDAVTLLEHRHAIGSEAY